MAARLALLLALTAPASALRTGRAPPPPTASSSPARATRRTALLGAVGTALTALPAYASEEEQGIAQRARARQLTEERVLERARAGRLASTRLLASLDPPSLDALLDVDTRVLAKAQHELLILKGQRAGGPEPVALQQELSELVYIRTRLAEQVARIKYEKGSRDDWFAGVL
jgi:hypothetical protein